MAMGPTSSDGAEGAGAAEAGAVPARLLVLDTMLPGQRLEIEGREVLWDMLAGLGDTPLVMVGRSFPQGQLTLHPRGVQVVPVMGPDAGTNRVLFVTTGRVAEVCDPGLAEESVWSGRTGQVRWLGTLTDDDAVLSPDDGPEAAVLDSGGRPQMEVGSAQAVPLPYAPC